MTEGTEERLRAWLALRARWALPLLVRWPLVLGLEDRPESVLGLATGRKTFLRHDIIERHGMALAGFVLVHELLHNLRRDPQRGQYRSVHGLGGRPLNQRLAILAIEHCVNVDASDALAVAIPDSGVDLTRSIPDFRREWDTWEDAYLDLVNRFEKGNGWLVQVCGAGGAADWGDIGTVDPDASNELEAAAAEAEASSLSAGIGDTPLGARLFPTVARRTTDWRKMLRHFMTVRRGDLAATWRLPSRRVPRVVGGPALPGRTRPPNRGGVVVVIDTSGSMTSVMDFALGEVLAMARATGSIRLVQCDCRVAADDTFDSVEEARRSLEKTGVFGGGGTSMDPALDMLADEPTPPRGVVVVTDGVLSWPVRRYAFPLMWVIVGDAQVSRPPQGSVVRVKAV